MRVGVCTGCSCLLAIVVMISSMTKEMRVAIIGVSYNRLLICTCLVTYLLVD